MARSPLTGQPAPDLSLWSYEAGPSKNREFVSLSELRGHPVVLDFWAGWCGACKRATPMLNELHSEYQSKGVSFYGVNVEAIAVERLQTAQSEFAMQFPTLHDPDGVAQRKYAVTMLPTVVVIDAGGLVRFASPGIPSKRALRGAIDGALE